MHLAEGLEVMERFDFLGIAHRHQAKEAQLQWWLAEEMAKPIARTIGVFSPTGWTYYPVYGPFKEEVAK